MTSGAVLDKKRAQKAHQKMLDYMERRQREIESEMAEFTKEEAGTGAQGD